MRKGSRWVAVYRGGRNDDQQARCKSKKAGLAISYEPLPATSLMCRMTDDDMTDGWMIGAEEERKSHPCCCSPRYSHSETLLRDVGIGAKKAWIEGTRVTMTKREMPLPQLRLRGSERFDR